MCTAMRVHCKVVNMHTIAHCLHQIVQNLNCSLDIISIFNFYNMHPDGMNVVLDFLQGTWVLIEFITKLGSIADPVIQAKGRLTFENDLRSGGLLCFTTQ